jgi:hypothetical protein
LLKFVQFSLKKWVFYLVSALFHLKKVAWEPRTKILKKYKKPAGRPGFGLARDGLFTARPGPVSGRAEKKARPEPARPETITIVKLGFLGVKTVQKSDTVKISCHMVIYVCIKKS